MCEAWRGAVAVVVCAVEGAAVAAGVGDACCAVLKSGRLARECDQVGAEESITLMKGKKA